ncbi:MULTISPECIES: hypothetical protein [Mesonia]|uniref:Uncharacterized protein n=1 Tax=Mesonia oceanica TaxID=2687242 RepID=A0AC61Y2K1_9FLAO|nr:MULTISPECIES: hypothetical protein [Mesonia]MAN28514.1 hypothetical protein [Mesonia sp.]MAQ41196.1 hypothetical protein [Mesonia sp.]MBJ97294.1 hypothetical protein [Flavobacteriaceae bacterium]VVU98769.1 hypothetical protein FVB9532_00015 [Mesonia oceanica]|tara:strand:+ start:80796 stop:81971 length:1176 start_codon:yes stop_codon:yes gene_type:complete
MILLQKFKSLQASSLILYFLLMFFVVEGFNKIFFFTQGETFFLQKLTKFLIFFIAGFYLLINSPKKLISLLILFLCFVIGQFFLEESFTKISLIAYSRYFFFILLIIFSSKPIVNIATISRIEKIFETLIVINSIIIILGLIFQLDYLSTYHGGRFGYNGLFMASSISTYFYITAFIYYLNKYKLQVLSRIDWWLAIAASCFIGTKSVYLSLFFIFGYLGFTFIRNRRTKILLTILLVLLVIIGGYIFLSSGIFKTIVKEDGWVTAILSHRNQALQEYTLPYIEQNWSIFNYFVGGIDSPGIRPQLEYIDLFLFFGIIGVIVFAYTFIKSFFTFKVNSLLLKMFLLLFAVTFVAGNFFYNASVPIYLIVLKLSILKTNKKELMEITKTNGK